MKEKQMEIKKFKCTISEMDLIADWKDNGENKNSELLKEILNQDSRNSEF